jgi:hypothetical protein
VHLTHKRLQRQAGECLLLLLLSHGLFKLPLLSLVLTPLALCSFLIRPSPSLLW